MTIYEIKERTKETSPHFFDKKTLKFFGQRMSSFKVYKTNNERYEVIAPIIDNQGKRMGETKRIFNAKTNELETLNG